MEATVLGKIVADKRAALADMQARDCESKLTIDINHSVRDFYAALRNSSPAYILECKKSSPSRGLLRDKYDLDGIAAVYDKRATVISVLTDEKYFQGSLEDLFRVRSKVSKPVLCKDFIIDPCQIRLARHYGADAILLMLSILSDEEYRLLNDTACETGMGVLTEVSNEEELERAIHLGAKVIGINNRDLRDLSVDLSRSRELAPKIPSDRIIISASGIHSAAQIRELSQYVDGFLIGTHLMTQQDLDSAVADLLNGTNEQIKEYTL